MGNDYFLNDSSEKLLEFSMFVDLKKSGAFPLSWFEGLVCILSCFFMPALYLADSLIFLLIFVVLVLPWADVIADKYLLFFLFSFD